MEKIKLLEGHFSDTDTAIINKALGDARREGRKEVVEWIDEDGIWAQVRFLVDNKVKTMWCLFPEEWQAFKDKLLKGSK